MSVSLRHRLEFPKPIARWDEALPLGNGLMGALVWGDGAPLRLSLDRADLWDLRPVPEWERPEYNYATMRRWVAEGRIDELQELYDRPYMVHPGPTKLPAGRLEARLAEGRGVAGSLLDLHEATAHVQIVSGGEIELFIHALEPVGLMRGDAAVLAELRAVAPLYAGGDLPADPNAHAAGELGSLGYPQAEARREGECTGFVQRGWGAFAYAIAVAYRRTGDRFEAAWSIATNREGDDPWAVAYKRAFGALGRGWAEMHESHCAWWRAYWAQADVRLPNPVIERQWALDMYKFGAAARRGAPPITLQAVWTADDGRIPPWKGDYHHDLNTELSYWPCYAGNHLQEGLSYLDWLWATRDEAYAFTRNFFGAPGLNVPMTADLLGRQIGGWHQYTHSATTGAWLAQHFVLHWRYSGDRAFLRERAYPYLSEVCVFLDSVLESDPTGVRFLPLTSSPEIHDNRLEAWLTPTSNYDLALIRWAFATAAELAGELGLAGEAERWADALAGLPPFSLAKDGRLMVSPDEALAASHRHFSHLMAIHPLGLVTWEQGSASQRIIAAAMAELERLGPSQWCGYSYAWLASLAARAKDGDRAETALESFAKAFCTANSFHVNGDQTKSGYSDLTYRPFTLEGNFAAAAGVHEMLLQSYGDVIRIFPAVPAAWSEAGFTSLRAEGGFLVSAERRAGRTVEVRVQAEAGGRLELDNPFAGAGLWRVEGAAAEVAVADGHVRAELQAGAVLIGRLE